MTFLVLWGFVFHVSNAALNIFILFLKHFLKIALLKSSEVMCPTSLKGVQKCLNLNNDEFIQYVVCPKCDSVYEPNACVSKQLHGHLATKQCIHIQFPNHSLHSFRQPCGTLLLQRVCRGRGNNLKFQPYKVYPYQSIKKALIHLCNRSNFLMMCEQWRQMQVSTEYMNDVYDGNI